MSVFTKDAIKKSFLELLEEKPISQITVKGITEHCGISRNSFYYHFESIPALIEEIICSEADRIISAHPSIDTIEDALNAILEFAYSNRRLARHIFNSVNRDIFEFHLTKICSYVITRYAEVVYRDIDIEDTDREIVSGFFRCTMFGIVIEWLNSSLVAENMSHDKLKRFVELFQGLTDMIIEKAAR